MPTMRRHKCSFCQLPDTVSGIFLDPLWKRGKYFLMKHSRSLYIKIRYEMSIRQGWQRSEQWFSSYKTPLSILYYYKFKRSWCYQSRVLCTEIYTCCGTTFRHRTLWIMHFRLISRWIQNYVGVCKCVLLDLPKIEYIWWLFKWSL